MASLICIIFVSVIIFPFFTLFFRFEVEVMTFDNEKTQSLKYIEEYHSCTKVHAGNGKENRKS